MDLKLAFELLIAVLLLIVGVKILHSAWASWVHYCTNCQHWYTRQCSNCAWSERELEKASIRSTLRDEEDSNDRLIFTRS